MIYQKCLNCNSEWNGISELEVCPFCKYEFEQQGGNFEDIEIAFKYIFKKHGLEVIRKKSLVSLLSDYAPALEKERRVVKIALDSDVYAELLSIDKTDTSAQIVAQAKAISKLNKEFLLDKTWAEQAILWLIPQLGWNLLSVATDKAIVPPKEKIIHDNSEQHILKKYTQNITNKRIKISIGEKIEFGSYPFEEDGTKRKIIWKIIDVKDNKVFLWSEMCLDVQPYHHIRKKCDWADADLRCWLTGEFVNNAFQIEELEAIQTTDIESSKNPKTKKSNGRVTSGRAFILSNEEFDYYQMKDFQLKARATPYAIKKGVFCTADEDAYYWVRTPGTEDTTQMFVGKNGHRNLSGNYLDQIGRGVRPALWVDYNILNKITSR